jgi:predicted phosphohydrolase
MVLVLFGDTHELHREVAVPAGDILICAGDFTMFSKNLSSIEDFNEWLGELPHRHKIVVPGNHESFLESNRERRSLLDNATVLIDERIEIEGMNIFGSPMTPLYGAAFGKYSAKDRELHWRNGPDDTHLLITHGPPFGILDLSPDNVERM